MKKVIYISYMHLSEKVARDWYIDNLIAKGIVVEYWDLIPLLFGGIEEANLVKTGYTLAPSTYDELEQILNRPENRGAIYVILIVYEGRFVKLFRLLSKYGCKTYFILWGQFPSRKSGQLYKFLGGLSDPVQLGKKVFYRLKGIIYKRLNLVHPFDVVFAAGQASMRLYPDARKTVPINLVDYDHYVRVESSDCRIVEGAYAVFLDINLPFQSDLEIQNRKKVGSSNYFSSCNHFFDIIERKFGMKVVIAAHPKADYKKSDFHGREIYKMLTPELVKYASFVVSHNSTSLCHAVLNRKPIIFIYTDEMKSKYKNTPTMLLINDIAAYLGANVYNIDEITDAEQIVMSSVDTERYNSFKYDFLTTQESEHTTTQDIFLNEIGGDQ